jgi:hypothetical protein
MPEGVSYEGVFGKDEAPQMMHAKSFRGAGGVVGGVMSSSKPMAPARVAQAVEFDRRDAAALTPAERKRQELRSRLHPALAAIVERIEKRSPNPTPEERRFVKNGKAEVQIWLADTSPQTIAALKRLGFELVLAPKTAKMVIGRLPIEKLAELAKLDAVRYVAPALG